MANEGMKVVSDDEMELIIPEGKKNVNEGIIMEDEETSENKERK